MVLFIALFSLLNVTLNSKTAVADLNNQEKAKPVQKVRTVTQEVTPQPEQPVEQAQPQPAPQPTPAPVVEAVTNCGDNVYKQYIYQHESGCRTDAVNSIGCFGIGQNCSGDVRNSCGVDFSCQDAWFSNYAISRYGSWEAAYNFWLSNRWW